MELGNSGSRQAGNERRQMTTERKITINLDEAQAINVAFLLGESYSKWGMELNHYMSDNTDNIYPQEAMDFMDVIDDIRDQVESQGIEWAS
jgi:hypothetical protein